jgi:hypothetical protein
MTAVTPPLPKPRPHDPRTPTPPLTCGFDRNAARSACPPREAGRSAKTRRPGAARSPPRTTVLPLLPVAGRRVAPALRPPVGRAHVVPEAPGDAASMVRAPSFRVRASRRPVPVDGRRGSAAPPSRVACTAYPSARHSTTRSVVHPRRGARRPWGPTAACASPARARMTTRRGLGGYTRSSHISTHHALHSPTRIGGSPPQQAHDRPGAHRPIREASTVHPSPVRTSLTGPTRADGEDRVGSSQRGQRGSALPQWARAPQCAHGTTDRARRPPALGTRTGRPDTRLDPSPGRRGCVMPALSAAGAVSHVRRRPHVRPGTFALPASDRRSGKPAPSSQTDRRSS